MARGLPRWRRMLVHYAARNAMLPNLTGFGMALGFVLSGALLTEDGVHVPGPGVPAAASRARPGLSAHAGHLPHHHLRGARRRTGSSTCSPGCSTRGRDERVRSTNSLWAQSQGKLFGDWCSSPRWCLVGSWSGPWFVGDPQDAFKRHAPAASGAPATGSGTTGQRRRRPSRRPCVGSRITLAVALAFISGLGVVGIRGAGRGRGRLLRGPRRRRAVDLAHQRVPRASPRCPLMVVLAAWLPAGPLHHDGRCWSSRGGRGTPGCSGPRPWLDSLPRLRGRGHGERRVGAGGSSWSRSCPTWRACSSSAFIGATVYAIGAQVGPRVPRPRRS